MLIRPVYLFPPSLRFRFITKQNTENVSEFLPLGDVYLGAVRVFGLLRAVRAL